MIYTKYDEDKTVWQIKLSSGIKAFKHDKDKLCSWKKLNKYLRKNPNIFIEEYSLKFRDHVIRIALKSKGYYFSNGLIAEVNSSVRRGYYVAGYLTPSKTVACFWYKIPELILEDIEFKKFSDGTQKPFFIWNN